MMKMFLVLLLSVFSLVQGKVTPDYFPQCKRNDPQIEKCILDAVEVLKPKLLEGIPEVAVPSIEPFSLPTLKLDRNAPSLRLKANVKNMKVYGGSNYKIEKFKLNLNNKYVAELKLSLPRVHVTADYDVRGSQVLTVDINGKGRMKCNFTNIVAVVKGTAKEIEKDGVKYLQVDKIIAKLKLGHGQVAFDDTERPVAASSAAAFFNASPTAVLEIFNPLIEESAATIFKAYANKIFSIIPLSEILYED
ncbi:uncharacterized protein LOC121729361 [Aricia agestis]|uniref:uncharacterized protein LOC121729361 n=1 Tax=Aricia agestis TaxID=91739 RepID=UPI001C208FBC|nr:uncharacterized protein LOC121729361 [Aricia agestis]XP_041973775.1 uncharacterized protein LOC121729361 [Aricia agestis]